MLAIREEGDGDEPLVLVHGAGTSGAIWRRAMGLLAARRKVVAPDVPGYGGSPPAGRGFALEEVTQCLSAGLDEACVGAPYDLVGHSMGGAIAQTLALARPERLAGLILVGTSARLRVLGRILELLRERPGEGVGVIQGLSYAAATPAERVAVVDRVLRQCAPLVTLGDYLACDRYDARPRLGAIRMPTLVVAGTEDRLTPVKYSRFLTDAIAGARLVEVADAGHFPQLEQPAAVNAAIREFLVSLPRGPAGGLAGATVEGVGIVGTR